MGMFDSVYEPCPKCGELNEFQSKGGDCLLNEYTLENALGSSPHEAKAECGNIEATKAPDSASSIQATSL